MSACVIWKEDSQVIRDYECHAFKILHYNSYNILYPR
jgi:hypothetical protein